MISAVDLLKGIAVGAGMKNISVEGANIVGRRQVRNTSLRPDKQMAVAGSHIQFIKFILQFRPQGFHQKSRFFCSNLSGAVIQAVINRIRMEG